MAESKNTISKEKLALQKAKEKEKERLAMQKAKEKLKEKERLAKEKEKLKEKERLAKEKEKEKQKLAMQKAKEKEKEKERLAKEKQKEKEKIAKAKLKEKEKQSNTQSKNKTTTNKPKIEIPESKSPINEPVVKKSLDELIKHDVKEQTSDKPLDHVEILKKKMEALKKLQESSIEKTQEDDIRSKLANVTKSSIEETLVYEEDTPLTDDNEYDNNELKEEINRLNSLLKEKDEIISKQEDELKDKSEQITILTNNIASKTEDEELLKEIEKLKEENNLLKENKKEETKFVDINNDEVKEIIASGDILLRIKLLNEKIAEKDDQIKLVEDELNKLSEKDIVQMSFTQQIKNIRVTRDDIVRNSNNRINGILELIRKNDALLKEKQQALALKEQELDEFNNNLDNSNLTYLEKENEKNTKRSKIIAAIDSIKVGIESLIEDLKKYNVQYSKCIQEAEYQIEQYNKNETDLISLYLNQLKNDISNKDPNYKESKEEREKLLIELNRLNGIYEEMKKNNIETEKVVTNDLDDLKKEYASICGKLNKISEKLDERNNVEEVLRTVDPEVSAYLNAFNEKESINLDNSTKEELLDNDDNKRIEFIISDNNSKLRYLDTIINKYECSEKVVFYKELINSMEELKSKEASLNEKAKKLKVKIDLQEENKEENNED